MKNEKWKRKAVFTGLFLIIGILFSGCSKSSNTAEINRDMVPQPLDTETLVAPEEIENTTQISRENFEKIKKGMSLMEVELIILGVSRLVSSDEIKGNLTETYRWETADSAKFIEVTLVQNKVVSKNQKGLK